MNLRYEYTWDVYNNLKVAKRFENGMEKLTMSYLYNSGGGRVVREKVAADDVFETYQDVYIAGGYERRKVQLWNSASQPTSIGGAVQGDAYMDVEGSRLVKYAGGLRIEKEVVSVSPAVVWSEEKRFLSFGNHLGSTSAVVDYDTGALVEWNTHYAYGADESRWKNDDEKYDNAEEPYGFTGKEEDKEVGLHYFGARYYSSYLGRWLSPDPPVVHGGGMTNHYNYGGNSPYIYVDPDGNWIHIVVGAVVGAVTGAIMGAIKGGVKGAFAGAAIGAASGALVAASGGAAAGYAAGGWAGAGAVTAGASAASVAAGAAGTGASMAAIGAASALGAGLASAGIAYGQARLSGASRGQAWLSAGISFASSAASFGLGSIGGPSANAFTGVLKGVAVGAAVSAATTFTQVAIATEGDLSKADWDDVMADYALNVGVSAIGSSLGAGLGSLGGGGNNKDVKLLSDMQNAVGEDTPLVGQTSGLTSSTGQTHSPTISATKTSNLKGQALSANVKNKIGGAFDQAKKGTFGKAAASVAKKYDLKKSLGKFRLYTGKNVPAPIREHLKMQGMKAITLGNNVYVNGEVNLGNVNHIEMIAHETVHVAQWNARGKVTFAAEYVADLVSGIATNNGDTYKAYMSIKYEREAYSIGDGMADNRATWW